MSQYTKEYNEVMAAIAELEKKASAIKEKAENEKREAKLKEAKERDNRIVTERVGLIKSLISYLKALGIADDEDIANLTPAIESALKDVEKEVKFATTFAKSLSKSAKNKMSDEEKLAAFLKRLSM